MSILDLFNQSFVHKRPSRTPNLEGGHKVSLSSLGSIQGRIRPASTSEQLVAQQRQLKLTHVLYVGPSEDVLPDDVVVLPDGVEITVVGVRDPSEPGSHREIDCFSWRDYA